MIVFGIDPGTKCGWALLDAVRGVLASGTWDLLPKRHEGGGMRFLRLRGYVREALARSPIDMVAYEEVRRHLGTDAAHIYGGIVAVITEECEARGLPYGGVPVGSVKKFATGKGNASKEEMIDAARARCPGFDGDDNEADAIHVAATALDLYDVSGEEPEESSIELARRLVG